LIKYAANALLATKVAFINEIADLAEATDGNITDIAKAVGMDTRIGEKFLQAGPGFGGSCFPKDMHALKHMGRLHNAPNQIIEAVIQSNTARKNAMSGRIIDAMNGTIAGKKIAILGVTFKANTDDMRDSVALDIIPQLLAAGAVIHIYDPAGAAHGRALLDSSVTWEEDTYAALTDADACVLLTDWPEFKNIDFQQAAKVMAGSTVIDLRNLFAPDTVLAAGFTYYSIGRTVKTPEKRLNATALPKIA